MNDENLLVSVIIPTFNSEKTIDLCLGSIIEQSYRNIEIIIVDNFSEDETEKLSKKYNTTFKQINGSRAYARNIGAKIAQGIFLLHVDSDMELEKNVIKDCILEIKKGADSIIIPEINLSNKFWGKCKSFEKIICMNEYGYEGVRFIKKEIFFEIGGYDEYLEAGEDFDLNFRIINSNVKISRIESFIKHHIEDLSFFKIINKSLYYSKTMDKYLYKNYSNIKKQERLYKIIFRKKELFLKNPLLAMGYFILIIFEYSILIINSNFKNIK